MAKADILPAYPGSNDPPTAGAPKVEWAVWNARQGFRVIPVRAGAKFPPTVRDAFVCATADETEIRRLWARPGHADDNPAIYLPAHVAIDVDQRDGQGKDTEWRASAQLLGLKTEDMRRALVVRTRKGLHAIWRRPDNADLWSGNGIEPHIDVRAQGAHGYLVAPGSVVEFQDASGEVASHRYSVVQAPEEIAELPDHLVSALLARGGSRRRRCEPGAVTAGVTVDDAQARMMAREAAAIWPAAVEFDGGHERLRGLVMKLGDLGLSPAGAIEVLTDPDGWNDQCSPPWPVEELDYQVRTMYQSRSRPIGCDHPDAEFAGVEIIDAEAAPTGLIVRNFAAIEMRAIEWLWPGLVPKGYLTIVAGESGAGKSTALADIVARVTTGAIWPGELDGATRRPGRVLWLGAEDSAAEMTAPRLRACGADLNRVTEIVATRRGEDASPFSMQDDIGAVEALLEGRAAGDGYDMLVIDPVTSYLPGQKLRKVDLNDAGQLRSILEPWLRLAEKHGLAVVCVTHFGKDTGRAMVHRVLGSSAFAQTCRSLLAVVQQPPALDGEQDPFAKALLQVKTNLPDHPGGAWPFRTERVEVGTDRRNGKAILATRPVWGQLDTRLTPERLANGNHGNRGAARKDAKFSTWLRDYFARFDPGAWADAGEVKLAAEGDGVASNRWWRENSPRFLEKRNENGVWLCRPIQSFGGENAPPIVVPDLGASS